MTLKGSFLPYLQSDPLSFIPMWKGLGPGLPVLCEPGLAPTFSDDVNNMVLVHINREFNVPTPALSALPHNTLGGRDIMILFSR